MGSEQGSAKISNCWVSKLLLEGQKSLPQFNRNRRGTLLTFNKRSLGYCGVWSVIKMDIALQNTALQGLKCLHSAPLLSSPHECRLNAYDGVEEFWVVVRESGSRTSSLTHEEQAKESKKATSTQTRNPVISRFPWHSLVTYLKPYARG